MKKFGCSESESVGISRRSPKIWGAGARSLWIGIAEACMPLPTSVTIPTVAGFGLDFWRRKSPGEIIFPPLHWMVVYTTAYILIYKLSCKRSANEIGKDDFAPLLFRPWKTRLKCRILPRSDMLACEVGLFWITRAMLYGRSPDDTNESHNWAWEQMSIHWVQLHAVSWVVRIDPLRFLAGCRKRRLNQALSVSVLSLSLDFFQYVIVLLTRATFCIVLFCVICVFCLLVVLVRLSIPVQVIDWKVSSPKWPMMSWWGR